MGNKGPSLAATLTSPGTRADILHDIADERVAEAKELLSRRYHNGAAYMVGYGVEIHLKAIIAAKRFAGYWPPAAICQELRHHNLEVLAVEAGMQQLLRQAARNNQDLGINWQTIRGWGPHLRYGRLPQKVASDMVRAVADTPPDGVAAWLRLRGVGLLPSLRPK